MGEHIQMVANVFLQSPHISLWSRLVQDDPKSLPDRLQEIFIVAQEVLEDDQRLGDMVEDWYKAMVQEQLKGWGW